MVHCTTRSLYTVVDGWCVSAPCSAGVTARRRKCLNGFVPKNQLILGVLCLLWNEKMTSSRRNSNPGRQRMVVGGPGKECSEASTGRLELRGKVIILGVIYVTSYSWWRGRSRSSRTVRYGSFNLSCPHCTLDVCTSRGPTFPIFACKSGRKLWAGLMGGAISICRLR